MMAGTCSALLPHNTQHFSNTLALNTLRFAYWQQQLELLSVNTAGLQP